jgi:hypothetical protein
MRRSLTVTARNMSQEIGKHATLRVAGTRLAFEVQVLDVRQRYGTTDYLVRPLAGAGEQWHAASSVTVSEAVSA